MALLWILCVMDGACERTASGGWLSETAQGVRYLGVELGVKKAKRRDGDYKTIAGVGKQRVYIVEGNGKCV